MILTNMAKQDKRLIAGLNQEIPLIRWLWSETRKDIPYGEFLLLAPESYTGCNANLHDLATTGAGNFHNKRPGHDPFHKRRYHRVHVIKPLVYHIKAPDQLTRVQVLAGLFA
jgi:hypothetical protein